MGLAAINSQANLLFGLFGLMTGVLLVSLIISKLVLRKLVVQRILPDHAVVGQPMTILYQLTNRKRFWPSLSITVAEVDAIEVFAKQPLAYMLHAAAQMTAIVPAEVVAQRRGLHQLGAQQVITSFPFGFIKRATERNQKDSLLVYPAIGAVSPRVIQMCRSAETSGAQMRPRRGGTDEFYGVKEYRVGENPRWIYWRHSARTGTLVSKEMTRVSPPRIQLLVDTYLESGGIEAQASIERVIAMAASLASKALEQGMSVGLHVWSNDWIMIPPNRGKRHRRDILSILARLEQNTLFDQRQLLEQNYKHQKSGTTAVLVTPHELRLSLEQSVRGGMVVLSSAAPQISRWFKFDRSVDFARCMPRDQQQAE